MTDKLIDRLREMADDIGSRHPVEAAQIMREASDCIAQLEGSAQGGYEDGWHALRNERDALRARIEGAPVMEVRRAASGKALDLPPPPNLIGKRVALVVIPD